MRPRILRVGRTFKRPCTLFTVRAQVRKTTWEHYIESEACGTAIGQAIARAASFLLTFDFAPLVVALNMATRQWPSEGNRKRQGVRFKDPCSNMYSIMKRSQWKCFDSPSNNETAEALRKLAVQQLNTKLSTKTPYQNSCDVGFGELAS